MASTSSLIQMNNEQRKAIRKILSGQEKDPVEIETNPSGPLWLDGEPPNLPSDWVPEGEGTVIEEIKGSTVDHNNLELDVEDIINKLAQLYPVHLSHAVSEVKCDILSKAITEDDDNE